MNGFSEESCLAGVEDYDLWLRLARKGCKMAFVRDVLGYYRTHDDSFSAKIENIVRISPICLISILEIGNRKTYIIVF